MKQQLKNQPMADDGDPDSRMDTERLNVGGERKKAAKGKGIRGSSKSGGNWLIEVKVFFLPLLSFEGSTSFWKQ